MSDQETSSAVETSESSESVAATAPARDEQLAALEAKLRDQALRAQAEIQNIQRRAERDVTQAHKFALEKFATELLAVVDNLERAIDTAAVEEPGVKALRDGVVLTHKLFIDALHKFQVEALNPVGEPFDPEWHQAVSAQPSASAEPNSVLQVLQKGYRLHGRLLRPAIVVVASAG